MRWSVVAVAGAMLVAGCTPGEGPESIPLPTSPDTTTSTTTTSTTTTTTSPETTTTEAPHTYEATIRRTTDGVPHIVADDLAGVSFGQGWVSAEDHACTLLDQILKVRGVRAATLGPGEDGANIESDYAWRAIGLAEVATADFDAAPAEVVEQFEAFAAGWNAQLNSVGAGGVTGWCTGASWVRPVRPVDVYVYARSLALLAGASQVAEFIPSARPPVPEELATGFAPRQGADGGTPPVLPDPTDLGSNAWAVGEDRTESGAGSILVGNPHFPWEGELRFAEVHLTVPGEVDIYGAQLLGVPGVGIGFNEGVAWSHTVSAGKRMTAYTLTLDPESPTSYLVDGESRPMIPTEHTIEILRADGTVDSETRTLWRSEYGPILDFPGVGWTDTSVMTYRDANIDNDEFIAQYLAMIGVDSLDDLIEAHREFQGVPLFNTIAAGSDGRVWYADSAATPNLSAEAEALFLERLLTDPLTAIAYADGLVVLDGSDSRFRWEIAGGARDPGLVPFREMPTLVSTDHVFNANDSFWVPSALATLDGDYSILHGEQGTPLSMRTRQNIAVLDPDDPLGLAGDDGLLSGIELRDAAFDNRAQSALLLRAAVVDACRAFPLVPLDDLVDVDGTIVLPAAVVDVSAACDALAAWDGRYDLDRAGPLVWREIVNQFDDADFRGAGPLFADEFDPLAPATTPSVVTTDLGPLLTSLARAVQILSTGDLAVDSTLGAAQFTGRSGNRIPVHGGAGNEGTTNVVSWSDTGSSTEPQPTRGEPVVPGAALRGEGHPVNYGTSFVFAVDYSSGDLQAWAMLTYGGTGDRESSLFERQTVRFSEKDWRQVAFSDEAIAADPALQEHTVVGD